MVYVLSSKGVPLMPTENHAKVRVLLKTGRAEVTRRCPFTIRLLYGTADYTQPAKLGIDAGGRHIGVSAVAGGKVLYEADVTLRNDIVELLSARREARRTRRNRKTRCREPRFSNRKRPDGWLAPSVRNKVETHLTTVRKVCEMLPISTITVETASFDIQKIKNPDISGSDYQQGEQMNFWNVREYVLFRDGHQCRCCHGKSKDGILNVHHIESRKTGGNAPNNLITLCNACHKGYHRGTVKLPDGIKRGMKFSDAAFMGIMRWAFYNRLKETYAPQGIKVKQTYGYITKNVRIANGLPKEHFTDARCISGNPSAVSDGVVYYQKKVRCHNRQIHKYKINKGGCRKRNQAPYRVKGFALHDAVRAKGETWFIHGRRIKGSFVLKKLDGTTLEIAPSKIKYLCKNGSILTERRCAG